MTLDKIKELHSRVNSELDASHFGKAISTVKAMLKETGLNRQVDNVERIGETFRYMLHYLLEGVPDEGRDRLLSEISEQLRGYADLALRAALAVDCPVYYYSLLRFNTLRDEHVSDILNSGYADTNVAAQALSAMTLAQLCFYDKAKLTAMLDIYDNAENPELAARALVGIVLSMIDNKARIEADTALMSRLSLWNDSIETYRRLQEVIKVIIGTRDTERVAAKMKDEVIPELMKLRPDIMKTLRVGSTELDAAMLENNPEWEEILSKSDLTKKMQELSEMQSDGADLMMVTFSNLKQFPFFNTAANWFLPFDSERSELNLSPEMKRMVEMLHNIGGVCPKHRKT